ncbi:unnamed protein product [Acanthoscelides obtectus]|uniref:Uncharacterized protein n=1 Tax=Acanthoscelides obtectus TaxID=200917 RepID=A0A9P0K621_ACAOB|nr:unnamed protein product [Acanthoscelides obtectus]CAK1652346.1 hypothetical protein AOBTE_LOCUS17799 [Acanthoscelides obtectus]
MEIDGYNVNAKDVGAGEQDLPDFPGIKWYSENVRENQYFLQIVKCRHTECCRPRSGLFRLLDNRFLPLPVKVKQTVDDLVLDEGGQFLNLPVSLALRLSASLKHFLQMPYDYFCPMGLGNWGKIIGGGFSRLNYDYLVFPKRPSQTFDDYGHLRFGKKNDLIDDYDHMRFGKRNDMFDDYDHLRFGKKDQFFDDYGHMRYGRGHDDS